MKILITGATGYIGGKMARYLASKGENVICLTRNNKTIDSLPIIDGDLLKPATLD
ncbi:NmrA-like protein, partial [Candidatus Magnetoovum chiemensis]